MRLAGLIPEVHPKSIEQREQALLVRHRARLIKLRTGAAGRIHAEIHSVGLHLERGRLLTKGGRGWLRSQAWSLLGSEQRLLVRTHLTIIHGLTSMIRGLDRRIARVGQEIPAVALLESIPGIGRWVPLRTEARPCLDPSSSRAPILVRPIHALPCGHHLSGHTHRSRYARQIRWIIVA